MTSIHFWTQTTCPDAGCCTAGVRFGGHQTRHSGEKDETIRMNMNEHTEERPFCQDLFCWCHRDTEKWADVGEALAAHLLEDDEAVLVIDGKMDLPKVA